MKLILIGSSTGGPSQLKFLLNDIELKDCAVVIAQHMNPAFIPSFVNQFNKEALSDVLIPSDREVLKSKIYICQRNMVLSGNNTPVLNITEEASSFNPGVDVLFYSAVNLCKYNKILALIMTGMGDDGAKSLFELYKAGVRCLCENEADSIVYGMPKKARDTNPNLKPMSLLELKKEIVNFIKS
ncbi:protein-glutamate methylesterase [Campylobacter lari]|uniref:CheB methylesterase domain-containing protein n=1 Tax=Campylobacter lari TaxID=201 RepID=UPI000DF0F845|nr:CheB methylesterase domain-containing protein [Campylobacter lari]EAK0848161.1 chemotaxis protein CheB [Campylobacter lari]EAK0979385.1 chemotaxis protein CheB [Campylobacter lari]MCR6543299.1 CheB methylesterase domain-containing protein [Campylobacter lari]STA73996.1 protein-glutamate methylesterase [Campylobacter lari]VEJ06498.1 protein-glutamate methylesterase [Campylobacter lari]